MFLVESLNCYAPNKQLNSPRTFLKINGRAAIVVPDNVLFEGETVRRSLLHECDVLFFNRKAASKAPWTNRLWIYDLRTNKHFTLKTNPLRLDDLQEFIECYNPENRSERKEAERFKSFTYDELMQRDKVNLDIFWLKDERFREPARAGGAGPGDRREPPICP